MMEDAFTKADLKSIVEIPAEAGGTEKTSIDFCIVSREVKYGSSGGVGPTSGSNRTADNVNSTLCSVTTSWITMRKDAGESLGLDPSFLITLAESF